MDQRPQEKVTKPEVAYMFDYAWAVVCKGCKQIHHFQDLSDNQILFPKGDFSVIKVYCRHTASFYEYANEEAMRPATQKSGTEKTNRLVAKAIDQINTRLTALENFVGIAKSEEEKKSLQERIAETEQLTTRIAEAILGDGSITQKPRVKSTPRGQIT
jgi:hypothetical protein